MILDEEIEFLAGRVNLRAHFFQLAFLMLEALLDVGKRGLKVGGVIGIEKFREETLAALEALAGRFALLFEGGDVIPDSLNGVQQGGVRLNGIGVRRIVGESNAGFAQEFLEERVHGLEAVGVANVVAEKNVMLEEENVILHAFEEDHAILGEIVEGSEIIAKKGATGFCGDVFFDVHNNLGDLLADAADNGASRGLKLGETRLNDVGLLAAFEMLAALTNPLLAFENQIGKLVAEFEGEKLQERQAEEQIDFDIFVVLGLGESALQKFGK
jgi:hypothetical protein